MNWGPAKLGQTQDGHDCDRRTGETYKNKPIIVEHRRTTVPLPTYPPPGKKQNTGGVGGHASIATVPHLGPDPLGEQ